MEDKRKTIYVVIDQDSPDQNIIGAFGSFVKVKKFLYDTGRNWINDFTNDKLSEDEIIKRANDYCIGIRKVKLV